MVDEQKALSTLAFLRSRLEEPGQHEELTVERLDLRNWNFVGADCSSVNFIACDLSGCDLSRALLYGHNTLSRFCRANLTAAQLAKGNFIEADFSDAILIDAYAVRADFDHANFQ